MATEREDETGFAGKVWAAFRAWLPRVRNAVMDPWRTYGAPPDPLAVYSKAPAWDAAVATFLPTLRATVTDGATMAGNQLGYRGRPVTDAPLVINALAQARNYLVAIPDEVADLVFAAILTATNAGETQTQIAERIDDVLDINGTPNWPFRSRRIARTETTRAWNAGKLALGVQMQAADQVRLVKTWRSLDNPATRSAHAVADGQTQPLTMPFVVGGEYLMYPGDPAGSPHNVIDCRCGIDLREEGR